jgi:hypothetical protein
MQLPGVAFAVALLASVLSLPAVADTSLVGKYAVEGREASGGASYKGEAAVAKKGTTYHVVWFIGQQMAIGTGILTDKVFAVTYMTQGTRVPGVALYEVASDGKLSGNFTMLGAGATGQESWTPLDR